MALPTWRASLKRILRTLQKAGALGLGAISAIAPPATSAERIEFFIGPLEPVILVEDLEAFAQDGTINDSFRLVANNMSEAQQQQLRRFLNWHLDAELISVSQFTYWQLGERLLDRAGQVVQTNSLQNGARPLRAALIAAASDGEGFTPLEVIQAFPLEVMQLDLARLQQIRQENRRFFAARQQLIGLLRSIGEREAAALPPPTGNLDPTRSGPYTWQRQVLRFDNPLREGEVPFDLYLPQRGPETDSTPVIVISHGASSGRGAFTYLAQHLASHGYAVVVPEHDDDHQRYEQFLAGSDRPPNPLTLISRPRDISLALDQVEQLAQRGGAYGNLEVNNVGVLGHSLGGFTALATAGAEFNFEALRRDCALDEGERPSLNISLLVQCDLLDVAAGPLQLRDDDPWGPVSDPRIQAVFAMSPPTSLFFGQRGLAQVDTPTLFLAASADIIVPAIPEQVLPYQWLGTGERYLVMAENANHFTFLQGRLTEGAIPLPSRLLGPDPRQAQPYLKALSVAFFDRHLRDQASAEGYLTQPYLDSLGTDPFRFAIVRDFRTE